MFLYFCVKEEEKNVFVMGTLGHIKCPTAKNLFRHLALEDQINLYGQRKRFFLKLLSEGLG